MTTELVRWDVRPTLFRRCFDSILGRAKGLPSAYCDKGRDRSPGVAIWTGKFSEVGGE